MKKLFTILTISTLATTMVFGATNEWTNFKNSVKKDVQTTNSSLKEAVKKDVEANKKAQQNTVAAKKAEKLKEVNAKLTDLNKQLKTVKNDKNMTNTEKAIKTRALEKQIEHYNKQKAQLQK